MSRKPFNRRDFLKIAGLSGAAVAGVALAKKMPPRLIVSQQEQTTGSYLPTMDLSGNQDSPNNFLPYAAIFIPVSSAAEYEQAFWRRLDSGNFFENNNYSPLFAEEWRLKNNVDAVNTSILKDFFEGRGSNIHNDFLYPENWQTMASTKGANVNEHWSLLSTIGKQGLGEDVRIIGYYTDTGQRPCTNIIRQVFVVEKENKRYFIKLQSIDDALGETAAVVKLENESPSTRISNMSIFKLNRTATNKIVITVSDAIEISPGVPAATLENYIRSNALTPTQQEQLLEIYRAGVRSMADTNDPTVFNADLLKLGNIVVDPQTNNLVVVDAFSADRITQVIDEEGLIRATNPNIQKHLLTMRNQLTKAGITNEQMVAIDQQVISEMKGSISSQVASGKTGIINIINEADEAISQISVKNDLGPEPIVLPQRIPLTAWEKLTTGLNITFSAIAGVILGSEIANKILSVDEKYEIPIPPIGDHIRRNMPYDLFAEGYADGRIVNEPYLLGHTTYVTNVANLKKMIERHRWVMNLREGLNLPTGNSQLKLILERMGPGMNVPDGIEAQADLVTEASQSLLKIQAKSPVITKNSNEKSLALINSELTELQINSSQTVELQNQFDNLDQLLSDEININWGSGDKWQVLNKLQQLYNEGQIGFWTLSDSGHIIYGLQTGENIELRYLAYEDNNKPLYKGTDGKWHNPKRAVTINELVNM